ncbi:MAG TPA: NAD-dependent epimerase/dehydratase family protein [Candidatus Binataceae bacterium]|nr:NAD-dependent epimerase/dehydratase family protein [Candidatus Binataceae bacterium]
MKPRIVITGVAGFIGSNLADRLLSEGYRVIGVDNLAYGVSEQIPDGVEFHRIDIRDSKLSGLIREGDVVFHLAAKNCIADCQQDPVETASINVTGTVQVFEAARMANARKVIYAESSSLYEGSQVLPTPESELRPESFYAVSKMAGMAFAEAYRRYFGLRTTALRYFCVYGPRQDYRRTIPPVMSAFILKLMRGESPTIYGSGQKRRDFIHVDDVNSFHLLCIDDPRTDDRVFNLGSGRNHSVKQIYEKIAAILHSDIPAIYEPDMPGEAQETLANIDAATALGWRPTVDLETGLRSFVEYYQRHGLGGLESKAGASHR